MTVRRGDKPYQIAVWSCHVQSWKLMCECSWAGGSGKEE